jgi:hypothetical protein
MNEFVFVFEGRQAMSAASTLLSLSNEPGAVASDAGRTAM